MRMKFINKIGLSLLLPVLLAFAGVEFAGTEIATAQSYGPFYGPFNGPSRGQPPGDPRTTACTDHGKLLDINNAQVIQWRTSTPNTFTARARIAGVVDKVFADRNGHRHFSLKIGPNPQDHVEVVFNLSFGQMPTAVLGDKAEACGDYITSIAQTGPYPPSPDGAIVHWVHRGSRSHEAGYVILNGSRYQ